MGVEMFKKDAGILQRASSAAGEVLGMKPQVVFGLAMQHHAQGKPIKADADLQALVAFEAAVRAQELLIEEGRRILDAPMPPPKQEEEE